MSSKNMLIAATVALTAACGGSTPRPTVVQVPTRTAKVTTTTTVHSQAPANVGGGPVSDHVDVDGPKRSDPARVDRLVEAKKEQFRDECYSPTQGLTSFVLDVTIAPSGAVEDATVASVNGSNGSNGSADVADCVRARLMQMKFPQSAEGGVHTLTFLYGR